MIYDKAKWHLDGDYPQEIPSTQAYIHSGLFLGWIIENGLYSKEFEEEFKEEISEFKSRTKTGPEIFSQIDGVLSDEELNDEGNQFTTYYYMSKPSLFFQDFAEVLCQEIPTAYHVENSWENFDNLAERIEQRYKAWKAQ